MTGVSSGARFAGPGHPSELFAYSMTAAALVIMAIDCWSAVAVWLRTRTDWASVASMVAAKLTTEHR